MEEQILQKIEEQNKKIENLEKIANKTRTYLLIIIFITGAIFILPFISAMLVVAI